MRSIILISVLISGLTAAALAGEPKYSRVYKACMGSSGVGYDDNAGLLNEGSQSLECSVERRLRGGHRQARPKKKKILIAAQRAWLRYRQTSCTYYASETGGTIDRITSNTCWLELTSRRALEMEQLLKNT